MKFKIDQIRSDFTLLNKLKSSADSRSDKAEITYLDSAATTQKPKVVVDAISEYYNNYNSNVHRSAHSLAAQATEKYEHTRKLMANFINAKSSEQIVFTSGVTDGINLVAHSFAKAFLKPGDQVLLTEMEHHANIVPWQMVAEQYGVELKFIPVNASGELDLENIELDLVKYFNDKTKLFCVSAMSNALGSVNPIKQLIHISHQYNIPVLVDGAQAIVHSKVDVQDLDCDFFVCSGHKMYGPTGVGVLYGKKELLEQMPPYRTGGEMIEKVTLDHSSFAQVPYKFEAGTPNIAGVIGLGAAIEYLNSLNWEDLIKHEHNLLKVASDKLALVDGLRIIGNSQNKGPIISFVIDDIHSDDVGSILDQCAVAVRVGHHCAMPLMKAMGVGSTVRVSFGMYNNLVDIDNLILALDKVKQIFA